MPWISVAEQKFKKQNFCLSSFPNAVSKCMCHFFNLCSWKTGRCGCWNRPRTINIHQRGVRVARSVDIAATRTAAATAHYVHGNSLWMRPAVWDWQPSGPHLKPGRDLGAERWTQQAELRKSTRIIQPAAQTDQNIFFFFHNNKSFSISRWDMNLFTEFAIINLCLGGKIFFWRGGLHLIW